jgi:hypothetical protein
LDDWSDAKVPLLCSGYNLRINDVGASWPDIRYEESHFVSN